MIRFAIKSALALALVSFFLPSSGPEGEDGTGFDPLHALSGIRAGVDDVLGICERAPDACAAGSNIGAFAVEQIGSGIASALGGVIAAPTRPVTAQTGEPEEASPTRETWADLDPELLLRLYATLEGEREVDPGEISPQMLDAVREAARLAREGGGFGDGTAYEAAKTALALEASRAAHPGEQVSSTLPEFGPVPSRRPSL